MLGVSKVYTNIKSFEVYHFKTEQNSKQMPYGKITTIKKHIFPSKLNTVNNLSHPSRFAAEWLGHKSLTKSSSSSSSNSLDRAVKDSPRKCSTYFQWGPWVFC